MLCIVKLFCWFLFRFFRWLQMIEKIEDWFAIIGFIWKICIILYHLHHLRAIIKKVGVFCFFVVYLKAVLFVFVSFYSDDCRWLQMIKKIEDWFAIIFLYHLYHHPKVEVFWFFLLYILELFCWFLFRFRWDDCWWLKRLKIDLSSSKRSVSICWDDCRWMKRLKTDLW